MSHTLLLPNRYKRIGWFIFIPSFFFGISILFFGFQPSWFEGKMVSLFPGEKIIIGLINVNLANTVIGVLFIAGALLVGFTKEKNEDEFISKIRLSSLLWAVLVNYILLIVAFVFIYETAFLNVMIYNMFTVLIIFILRFNYILYKSSKSVSDEK